MLDLVKAIWSKVKSNQIFWTVIIGVTLFGSGYYLGVNKEVPVEYKERLVEDIVSKQKLKEQLEINVSLRQQLEIANVTITDLKSHVRVVERIVRTPDGTETIDRTTDTNTDSHTDSRTDTTVATDTDTNLKDSKDSEIDTKTHKDLDKVVTPVLRDKYYLGLSARIDTKGIANPGVQFNYKVFDFQKFSIWSGAEVIAPTRTLKFSDTEFRLNIGVSW